jgi:hypothetical protein
LNYLYAILEVECRLAAATLGLDPGIGVSHVDTPSRDSLACDLMQPVRPEFDKFVLDWLKAVPLSRSDFFEERDGNCRLMAQFAERLSQTASIWARLVAPIAEWFVQEVFRTSRTPFTLTSGTAHSTVSARGEGSRSSPCVRTYGATGQYLPNLR